MLVKQVSWKKTADRFEGKSHKFMHASRRLNILANDMLRYVDLCESLAHIAREGYAIKKDYKLELEKRARLVREKKEKEYHESNKRLNHLHKRIRRISDAFAWRGKELKRIEKVYREHIKKFSEALKS